jgi:hypothetical protein
VFAPGDLALRRLRAASRLEWTGAAVIDARQIGVQAIVAQAPVGGEVGTCRADVAIAAASKRALTLSTASAISTLRYHKLNVVSPPAWLADTLTKRVNRWSASRIDELMRGSYTRIPA